MDTVLLSLKYQELQGYFLLQDIILCTQACQKDPECHCAPPRKLWSSTFKSRSGHMQSLAQAEKTAAVEIMEDCMAQKIQLSFLMRETLSIFFAAAQISCRRVLTRLYTANRASGYNQDKNVGRSLRNAHFPSAPYFNLYTLF